MKLETRLTNEERNYYQNNLFPGIYTIDEIKEKHRAASEDYKTIRAYVIQKDEERARKDRQDKISKEIAKEARQTTYKYLTYSSIAIAMCFAALLAPEVIDYLFNKGEPTQNLLLFLACTLWTVYGYGNIVMDYLENNKEN